MPKIVVDMLTGQILDATADEVFTIDIPNLDLLETIVNNWSPAAALGAAHRQGWTVNRI